MTRPSPGFLGVFLIAVALVLAGAGLAKGGLYIGKHEGDTLHLLQIVLREARGQWPHLDFQTPIGVLATAPIALFVWLGAGIGHAILYAQALVAVLALPAIWWVAASRFRGGAAYLFGALVLVLILALVHGEAERSVSISMHYNRWAWAAAFVAIACAMLPSEEEFRSPVADGLVIGGGAGDHGADQDHLFRRLPASHRGRAHRAPRLARPSASPSLTGLAVALAVTLLAGTPFFWLAYLRDLFTVMASEVRPQPGLPLAAVVGAPAYMGGSLVLLLGVVLLRQSGRTLEGLVLLLLVPGFFYVTYQNFRNDPQWLWLLGLLLFTLRPAREHYIAVGWEAQTGAADRRRGRGRLLRALGAQPRLFAVPPSRHRHRATTCRCCRAPAFTTTSRRRRIRAMRVDAKVALDARRPALRRLSRPRAAQAHGDVQRRGLARLPGRARHHRLVRSAVGRSQGLGPHRGQNALPRRHPVVLLALRRRRAAARAPRPGTTAGCRAGTAADYLLVPLCPLSTKVRKLILDEVTESGADLTEVRRNAYYVLFAKAPVSP